MNRMRLGLTSVTFRQKTAKEIIRLAAKAGLDGIEWGGDLHVQAGDTKTAQQIGEQTRAAGLSVLSYGSYYRCGKKEDFTPVLASAKALGAPVIRVWAGNKAYEALSEEERKELADTLRAAAQTACEEGMTVALEYHRGTATQTIDGTLSLLRKVHHGNLFSYWQPNPEISVSEQLAEIDALLPFLQNVHVFCWTEQEERRPLSEGRERWTEYLRHVREGGRLHDLIIEFVRDDAEDAFLKDACTLHELAETLKL